MIIEWMGNYLIHSTLLMLLALALRAVPRLRRPDWQDGIWKTALLAGLITASLQTFLPIASLVEVATIAPPSASATAAPATAPRAERVSGEIASAAPVPMAIAEPTRSRPVEAAAWTAPSTGALAAWGWFIGAGWLLFGLLTQLRAERRLLADRCPVTRASRDALCGGLAVPADIVISQSDRVATPIATRGREIVLPLEFDALPEAHRSAAIAHELAHVLRRDPLWRLLALTVERIFFFQPLNRLASRELDRAAEAICDHDAVARTGDRRPLLECLGHFAGVAVQPRTLCAMAATRLPERIEALLTGRNTAAVMPRRVLPVLVATVLAGSVLLPGITLGTDQAEPRRLAKASSGAKHSASTHIRENNGFTTMSVSHRDGERSLRLKAEGVLEFNEDFTDLVAIGGDGFFDLTVNENGTRYSLEISPERDGLERRFRVDGERRPWDADARAWFSDALVTVFRATGMAAERRVSALLDTGGVEAVIDELRAIESDMVTRVYVTALARRQTLSRRELNTVLELVDDRIDSDLESRLSLAALMEQQDLDRRSWELLLGATATIRSDLEQRLVLVPAAEQMPAEPELLAAWLEAVDGIDSDLERRLALSAATDHFARADEALLLTVVDAMTEIGSDLEHRLALASLAPYLASPATQRAYIASAGELRSDLEGRLAFATLLDEATLDEDATAALVATAARSIGSDLELRLLLGNVLDDHGRSDVVQDAVLDALDSISSDFEREQIARRLRD